LEYKKEGSVSSPFLYFLGLGGLFPLPLPESFPVVLGALTGLFSAFIFYKMISEPSFFANPA